jgi:hypothetical protein
MITDSNGCVLNQSFILNQPALLTVLDTVTNASCSTCNDGSAEVFASGGIPPYSILWSTGDTVSSLTGLLPGTYFACITDQGLCEFCDTVVVSFSIGLSPVQPITIDIYPNPFDQSSVIRVTSSSDISKYIVSISNSLGEILLKSELREKQIILDGGRYDNGIYYLQIRDSRGIIMLQKMLVVIH